MKAFSPINFLTAVVLALVSPSFGWGEEDCSNSSLATLESKKKAAEEEIQLLNDLLEGNVKRDGENSSDDTIRKKSDRTAARNRKIEIEAKIQLCNKLRDEKKEQCNTWKTERKDLLDKFTPAARVAAQVCLDAYEDDEGNLARSLMQAQLGQVSGGRSECELGSAKTTNKDKINDITKDIDKLESGMRKADSEIMKVDERSENELERINEERKKLKEDYESAMEAAEDAQIKAMANLRDQQIKLADNIQQLKTAAITARQNVESVQREHKAAMSMAKAPGDEKSMINLRSEVSILSYCKRKGKATVGNGLSKNGAARAQEYKDTVQSCVDALHDHRSNLSQSFANALEHRINQQSEIETKIDTANKQYAQLTDDYNQMLERLKTRMTKAQQKYYTADNDAANRYNKALQRAQQEKSKIQMEKMQDQQKMMGKYNSQGKLSNSDAEEIIATADDLDRVETGLQKNCAGFENLNLTSKGVKERVEKAKDGGVQ